MDDITQTLLEARTGNRQAAADLLPLVYEELRRLAQARMAQEASDHTLQPTALVHEAYLRLVRSEHQSFENRSHFFGAAAEAMRRILVDHARRKLAQKRGAGLVRMDLDDIQVAAHADDTTLLHIDASLDLLAKEDPQAAELVKLRFFTGLTHDEAALALGISPRTAKRAWSFARAWLYTELRRGEPRSPQPPAAA